MQITGDQSNHKKIFHATILFMIRFYQQEPAIAHQLVEESTYFPKIGGCKRGADSFLGLCD